MAFFGDDPRPNLPKLCSCLQSLPWQLGKHTQKQMGVYKNRGTPKWMVKIMENPIKMDDLGVPLFLVQHPDPHKTTQKMTFFSWIFVAESEAGKFGGWFERNHLQDWKFVNIFGGWSQKRGPRLGICYGYTINQSYPEM